jgi:hypothetical protein
MTNKEVEEGMKALFDEALAVAMGEIDEDGMTMPTELESLIRVSTFEEEGILSAEPGLVLRFNRGGELAEFQIGIVRSR